MILVNLSVLDVYSGALCQVWDRDSYALVKTLPTQNHWVRTLQVAGKFLYSGSYQAVKVHTYSMENSETVCL